MINALTRMFFNRLMRYKSQCQHEHYAISKTYITKSYNLKQKVVLKFFNQVKGKCRNGVPESRRAGILTTGGFKSVY